MNITKERIDNLKLYIANNIDLITDILEKSNFCNISYRKYNNSIRCSYDKDSNPTSVYLNCETLSSTIYSKDINGDIFSLVEFNLNTNFINAFMFVQSIAGFSDPFQIPTVKKANECWNGWYKKYLNKKENPTIYDNRLLNKYSNYGNLMFLNDGIGLNTQRKYGIMYDIVTNRVVIPHFDINGNLLGVIGRANKGLETNFKYLPIVPQYEFPRRYSLYGCYQNKEYMTNGTMFIFEAEKSVMQLDTMGINLGVALGGKVLHDKQINVINAIRPKHIVVCLDESVELEHIIKQIEKLKEDINYSNAKVGYLYDGDNVFLEKCSKQSPTDLGKETFLKLLKECLVWVD